MVGQGTEIREKITNLSVTGTFEDGLQDMKHTCHALHHKNNISYSISAEWKMAHTP